MTDELLELIIGQFDKAYRDTANPPPNCATRWVSANVLWVYSWEPAYGRGLHEFYLVRHGTQFAGIVYVMLDGFGQTEQTDLHALVINDFRGHGLPYPAMRDIVLPHILNQPICDRGEKVSILATTSPARKFSDRSERMLAKLGFIIKSPGSERQVWEYIGQRQKLPDYAAAQPFPPRNVVLQNAVSVIDDAFLVLCQIESSYRNIRPDKRANLEEQLRSFCELTFELLGISDERKDPGAPENVASFPVLQKEAETVLQKLSAFACQVEVHCFNGSSYWQRQLRDLESHLKMGFPDLLEEIKWNSEAATS